MSHLLTPVSEGPIPPPTNHGLEGQFHDIRIAKALRGRSDLYPTNFSHLTDQCEDKCRARIDEENYYAVCRDQCIANEYLKRGHNVAAGVGFHWRDNWEYLGGASNSHVY